MTDSIPIPAHADLTQYDHIQSKRPTDGAIIRAQRVVVDKDMPICWTIVMKDKLEKYIFNELPLFEDTQGRVCKQYSTSELIHLAQKAGFGEWQQSMVAAWEGWEWDDVGYREKSIPQYQLPDTTPYPVD